MSSSPVKSKNIIDNNVTYANTMPTQSAPVPSPPKSRPPAITPPIGGVQVLPAIVSKSSSSSSSTITTVSSNSSCSSTSTISVSNSTSLETSKRTTIMNSSLTTPVTSSGGQSSGHFTQSNSYPSSGQTHGGSSSGGHSTIVPIPVQNVRLMNESSGQLIRPIPVVSTSSSASIVRPTMGQQQLQTTVMDGHSMTRTSSKPPLVPHSNQHLQPRTYIRSPPTIPTQGMNYGPSGQMSMGSMTPGLPSDDQELLNQLTSEELIKRIKQLENRNRKLIYDNGSLMKDLNQSLSQLQSMKHHNFQLMGDNNELRDLCCYLDDERSKARTLAKEWQQFSQHMSKVMRHEVSTYASKLTVLENKQFELVRENFELKQLCLMLDNAIQSRDQDGSTGTGSNNEMVFDGAIGGHGDGSRTGSPSKSSHKMVISQQILEYIRSLEMKCQQLEWEKKQSNRGTDVDGQDDGQSVDMELSNIVSMDPNINCPPAVTEAMRVLRIHESMEKLKLKDGQSSSTMANSSGIGSSINSPMVNNSSNIDGSNRDKDSDGNDISSEQQKALVRSLCNVAWKKIEDGNIV